MTAGDVAKAAGWDEGMYSRCRAGRYPIPEKRALAVQKVTRSDAYPEGIAPTPEFWPGGVRVVVKK
jgi:hypothetical protein